ncbi:hypothetical protein ADUPG1_009754, partial [Aduncisulcus paluster]
MDYNFFYSESDSTASSAVKSDNSGTETISSSHPPPIISTVKTSENDIEKEIQQETASIKSPETGLEAKKSNEFPSDSLTTLFKSSMKTTSYPVTPTSIQPISPETKDIQGKEEESEHIHEGGLEDDFGMAGGDDEASIQDMQGYQDDIPDFQQEFQPTSHPHELEVPALSAKNDPYLSTPRLGDELTPHQEQSAMQYPSIRVHPPISTIKGAHPLSRLDRRSGITPSQRHVQFDDDDKNNSTIGSEFSSASPMPAHNYRSKYQTTANPIAGISNTSFLSGVSSSTSSATSSSSTSSVPRYRDHSFRHQTQQGTSVYSGYSTNPFGASSSTTTTGTLKSDDVTNYSFSEHNPSEFLSDDASIGSGTEPDDDFNVPIDEISGEEKTEELKDDLRLEKEALDKISSERGRHRSRGRTTSSSQFGVEEAEESDSFGASFTTAMDITGQDQSGEEDENDSYEPSEYSFSAVDYVGADRAPGSPEDDVKIIGGRYRRRSKRRSTGEHGIGDGMGLEDGEEDEDEGSGSDSSSTATSDFHRQRYAPGVPKRSS